MPDSYFTFQTTLITTWTDKNKNQVQIEHSVYLSKNIANRFIEDASLPDDFIELKQAVETAKRSIFTSENLHFKGAELSDKVANIEVSPEVITNLELDLDQFKAEENNSDREPVFVLENGKYFCIDSNELDS